MQKVLIISTGGTFNKVYEALDGSLPIDTKAKALDDIASHWLCHFKIVTIIGKDSLDINEEDRKRLTKYIKKAKEEKILIIHGTDTMNITAQYFDNAKINKQVILTGAMQPYSINPIEATANFASAYGFLLGLEKQGIYIAMHSLIQEHKNIQKNKKKGYFELKD